MEFERFIINQMSDKRELLFRGARADDQNIDQYDDGEQVRTLRSTIGALKQVSNDLGTELDRQNALLDNMHQGINTSSAIISRLLEGMDKVYKATGLGPTTLTFLFAVGLVLFLWAYWKFYA